MRAQASIVGRTLPPAWSNPAAMAASGHNCGGVAQALNARLRRSEIPRATRFHPFSRHL
jgi:hypothetical protein